MQIQYVTDEKGRKTVVQLSLKQWHDLQKSVKKLEIFEDLKQSFKEMEADTQGKLTLLTTEQLLSKL